MLEGVYKKPTHGAIVIANGGFAAKNSWNIFDLA